MEDHVLELLGISPLDSHYRTKVQSAIAQLGVDATARLNGYLSEVDLIQSSLVAERSALGGPYQQLKVEGRRFSKLISILLQIEIQGDVW